MSTESSIKVGVCVSPLTDEERDGNLKEIITTEECEVKVCMGEGRGQKSYEVDFEVSNFFVSCWLAIYFMPYIMY